MSSLRAARAVLSRVIWPALFLHNGRDGGKLQFAIHHGEAWRSGRGGETRDRRQAHLAWQRHRGQVSALRSQAIRVRVAVFPGLRERVRAEGEP